MKKVEPKKRGRPSVGPQITIRMPDQMLADIAAALRDAEDRAAFIRNAIDRELRRRRKAGS